MGVLRMPRDIEHRERRPGPWPARLARPRCSVAVTLRLNSAGLPGARRTRSSPAAHVAGRRDGQGARDLHAASPARRRSCSNVTEHGRPRVAATFAVRRPGPRCCSPEVVLQQTRVGHAWHGWVHPMFPVFDVMLSLTDVAPTAATRDPSRRSRRRPVDEQVAEVLRSQTAEPLAGGRRRSRVVARQNTPVGQEHEGQDGRAGRHDGAGDLALAGDTRRGALTEASLVLGSSVTSSAMAFNASLSSEMFIEPPSLSSAQASLRPNPPRPGRGRCVTLREPCWSGFSLFRRCIPGLAPSRPR